MPDYDFKKIEKKWSKKWLEDKTYEPDLKKAQNPFYNLMMFPYPSAEGLHVGNMYAFVGADIYGRKKRMEGKDVFEPIGLDGFGIHSENYAIKIGKHPKEQAKISEKNFYKQLEMIGNGFSWDERLETYDPEYYKWTQWIFVQMFKKGLAYRKKAEVNWCPNCLTVLADEQVLQGECERCATAVVKKELEQWFFKITDYAERLLNDLERIDWSERVKIAQRNWMGKSEGTLIKFDDIEIFTTRPDTIFGATFVVVAGKKDRFTGRYVTNPATKEKVPVWEAEYVMADVGTGAIMAVPAHDERDMEFAKKFNLPVSDAPLVDKDEAIKKVGGRVQANYHLRDWLISRQRYWGPPIPMIYCEKCARLNGGQGWQAVPEEDLPVLLPDVKDFRPTGTDKSPLATIESFVKTKCPKCGGEARRETDVSDTFLDSAWYFFRYTDAKNKKEPFDKLRAKKWLPVDMYIGGAEHAVLHLLYSRFLTKVFHDWGLIDFDEPFEKFRAHGLLVKDGAKMSKSKGNVVNPDEYIKKFGADVLRMYLMFLGPFEQGGDFRDESIAGIVRFLDRVWKLGEKIKNQKSKIKNQNPKLERVLHQSIKKIGEDIENLRYNTAISQLMILLSAMEEGCGEKDFKIFLKLLAPFAPFLAEELWNKLGDPPSLKLRRARKESIHKSKWPEYDEEKIKEDTKTVVVQINGKVKDKFETSHDVSDSEIEKTSLERPKIKELLAGTSPKKVIVAKGRLVNIVL